MNFIIDYWHIILAILFFLGLAIFHFLKLPAKVQLRKVREWLLWAVTEAEKQLGGGTGKLKLRLVYDWFVTRFGWLARLISFETFAGLVDDALEEMREMLAQNACVQDYVEGGGIK